MSGPHQDGTPFDQVIIGAGIAGASLAWWLAPHGRVLMIEREAQPGMHSTGRSAAMFMESYGSPQARALTRASRDFYSQPPAGFASVPILTPRGVLYVGWQGQEAALDALQADLEGAAGPAAAPISRLDAQQALAQAPVLVPGGLLGGIAEPDAMDIDVDALHQGFLRGAKAAGAALWTGAELLAAQREEDLWHLRLADGRQCQARCLVNAAGAWADEAARRCQADALGVQPKRRSAFIFEAQLDTGEVLPADQTRHWPSIVSVDETWYFKPDAGALLGSPANADPVAAHDVQPEELDIAQAIDRIQTHTRLRIRRPRRTWAGLRTFAPDGELLIGWDARRSGFFWLAGQGGYGIQSAAAAGETAALLLRGLPVDGRLRSHGVDANALSPSRLSPP